MVSIYSDVLERDGTAVDAAIAAMFCNGVYSPHSLGIGGGFFMTLYIAETGEVITLNSREVAPAAASEAPIPPPVIGSRCSNRSYAT